MFQSSFPHWNKALDFTEWKLRRLWLILFSWLWGLIYFSITMLVSSLLQFRKSQCSNSEQLIFITSASHLPDPGLNLTTLASLLCLPPPLFCKYLGFLITKNTFFFHFFLFGLFLLLIWQSLDSWNRKAKLKKFLSQTELFASLW